VIDRRADPLAAALLAIAAAGALIAAYLTIAHYASAPLACIGAGIIDCNAVTTSSFSLVPGTQIPVAAAGLVWFALLGAAAALALRSDETWLATALLVWCLAGVLVVLYLVYGELVVVNRICEWCTAVHVLVVAAFVIALRRVQLIA
jgi:uncharacterized membrane protein